MNCVPFVVGCDMGDLRRFRAEELLAGDIKPGQVFAWEPMLYNAAALIVVTKVGGGKIFARDIDGDRVYPNDESRFREACVRTILHDHPVRRPRGPMPVPMPETVCG